MEAMNKNCSVNEGLKVDSEDAGECELKRLMSEGSGGKFRLLTQTKRRRKSRHLVLKEN